MPFRQFDSEGYANDDAGLESDPPAHLLHERLGDTQPQTGAAFLTATRSSGLSEFLEDVWAKRFWDTSLVVGGLSMPRACTVVYDCGGTRT